MFQLLTSFAGVFIGVLFGILATIGTKWLSDRRRIHGIRAVITQTLDLARRAIAADTPYHFRANVMMPGEPPNDDELVIRYHSGMTGAADRNIRLRKGHGVAGRAWDYGGLVNADLTHPEAEGGPAWGLTPEQVGRIKGIKAILSVPIFHPDDPDKIIGILNFDSEEEAVAHLAQEVTQDIAVKEAALIAHLLQISNVI